MIIVKSEEEIALIEKASKVVVGCIGELKRKVEPGITTASLDKTAVDFIRSAGAEPAFYNYRGFPGNICASLNEEVVHGIPGGRRLEEGDILKLDIGVKLNGYFSDAAVSVPVGKISDGAMRLMRTTEDALYKGIECAKPGARLSDISAAIQGCAERAGYSVVREFVGHGIGLRMHEEPQIPNFGRPNEGPKLAAGMVLAIEPMVNAGSWEVEILSDGWTAVTKDRKPSAHFEHTVALTAEGPKILTKL